MRNRGTEDRGEGGRIPRTPGVGETGREGCNFSEIDLPTKKISGASSRKIQNLGDSRNSRAGDRCRRLRHPQFEQVRRKKICRKRQEGKLQFRVTKISKKPRKGSEVIIKSNYLLHSTRGPTL